MQQIATAPLSSDPLLLEKVAEIDWRAGRRLGVTPGRRSPSKSIHLFSVCRPTPVLSLIAAIGVPVACRDLTNSEQAQACLTAGLTVAPPARHRTRAAEAAAREPADPGHLTLDGCLQVLQQVKAVGDLPGLGGTLPCGLGVEAASSRLRFRSGMRYRRNAVCSPRTDPAARQRRFDARDRQ